jgi:hypothetical protein
MQQFFREQHVTILMVADWTNTATPTSPPYLAEFGRNGVPLYTCIIAPHGEPARAAAEC